MKVIILGKLEFNKIMKENMISDSNVESQDVMFISVNSPANGELNPYAQTDVKSHFNRQHSNVMIMHFGDYGEEYVTRSLEYGYGSTGLFTEPKAKKLYEFIKKNQNKSMAIVHCGAGISRSGAIGTFIHKLYGTMTWEEFMRTNPRIQPNGHVLKLLRTELEKDK